MGKTLFCSVATVFCLVWGGLMLYQARWKPQWILLNPRWRHTADMIGMRATVVLCAVIGTLLLVGSVAFFVAAIA